MRFQKSGDNYFLFKESDYQNVIENLPAGNYVIKFNDRIGFYFQEIEDFSVEGKIYGNPIDRTNRILNTYESRPNNTGVLLAGEKGSGKTLQAKLISIEAQKRGYPTIVVNQPLYGDEFNQFMQNISQPCIVLFDEFEKVYSDQAQEAILTLLDGVFQTKKLFILTCNDFTRIDNHLKNRPGRIFYNISYKGLDPQFVKEYAEDNLLNQGYVSDVVKLFHLFDTFNFDILKALVEEMNRYGENVQQAMLMLNAKTFSYSQDRYDIKVTYNGKVLDNQKVNLYPQSLSKNPAYVNDFYVDVHLPSESKTKKNSSNQKTVGDMVEMAQMGKDLREILAEFMDEDSNTKKTKTLHKRWLVDATTKREVDEDGVVTFYLENEDVVITVTKSNISRDYGSFMGYGNAYDNNNQASDFDW